MGRRKEVFPSRVLDRDIAFLWKGRGGRVLLAFPALGGPPFEQEAEGFVAALADRVAARRLRVCCLDGQGHADWRNLRIPPGERMARHDAYDRFLAEEFLPYVAQRAGREDVVLFGPSLGGYLAVDFAARHPEQVARCVAFSGILDCRRLLDGHWDDLCYFHCPTCFVPNMDEEWVRRLARVEWVLAAGEHDGLAAETRNFAQILRMKGIGVYSEIWPGAWGHDWPWWNEHIGRFVA